MFYLVEVSDKKKVPSAPLAPATPSDAILESISDGVFTVDADWRITSFNRAAAEITGVPRAEAIGAFCFDVFRSNMCAEDCALRKTLKKGKAIIGQTGFMVDASGHRKPISVSTALLRDENGGLAGGAETFRDLSELQALRQELGAQSRVGDLVSHSPAMQKIMAMLPAIAESPSTVLIHGETGTGKERVARTLHALSPRRDGPFVAINCGALPDSLLESELFGYKAGAFTGATRDKPGRFAQAKGGTLFLDEIGEVSSALQVRLLRVLQERVYEPLGSSRSEKADVRILVATHQDLAAAVRSGRFREDLYYRIHVVRLELPPLRKRKEDIPLLVESFIQKFNLQQGRMVAGIACEALSLLAAHDWPGNVRELENTIERCFILCGKGPIEMAHLPEDLLGRTVLTADVDTLQDAHAQLDAQAIMVALQRNGNNRLRAAAELGVHKTTFFRWVKRLGLELPREDGRN
jgi:PAS domain S-box-containing protein